MPESRAIRSTARILGCAEFTFRALHVCLCLLLFSAGALSAQNRITFGGRFGLGSAINEYYQNTGYLVHNQGSTSATFRVCDSTGNVDPATPFAVSLSPALTGTSNFNKTGGFNNGTSAFTINAGETVFVHIGEFNVKCPNSSDLGLHTASFQTWYKVNGAAPSTTTFSREVQISGTGSSSTNASGSGVAVVASGLRQVYGGDTSTSPPRVSWGLVTIGSVPPLGMVTVDGLVGNYVAQLLIDGAQVDEEVHNPQPPAPTLPGPEWVWQTTTPATYVNKSLLIKINGRVVWTQTITPDSNGNFGIFLEFDPANPEYLLPVTGPDGEPLPMPGDDLTNSPNPELDPPPANPGINPIGDTTAASSMTVKDHYRATRQAVEDSLKGSNTPNFNLNEWLGNETPSSSDGMSAGASVGDALEAAGSGVGGIGEINLPGLGGAEPLRITVLGFTAVIPVMAGAGIIRGLLLAFLVIATFILCFRLLRGAFTNSH